MASGPQTQQAQQPCCLALRLSWGESLQQLPAVSYSFFGHMLRVLTIIRVQAEPLWQMRCMCKLHAKPLADTILTECPCTCRAQAAAEPVGTGAEAVLQAITRATAPSGPLAGDRKVRLTFGTYILSRRLDHSNIWTTAF